MPQHPLPLRKAPLYHILIVGLGRLAFSVLRLTVQGFCSWPFWVDGLKIGFHVLESVLAGFSVEVQGLESQMLGIRI